MEEKEDGIKTIIERISTQGGRKEEKELRGMRGGRV